MKIQHLTATVGAFAALSVLPAFATDITIKDLHDQTAFNGGPYGDAKEDNSVIGGALATQAWDYEAFTQNGNKLGIVAGFAMNSGKDGSIQAPQGDIFIRLGQRVDYQTVGSQADPVAYDYVIHFTAVPNKKADFSGDYWAAGTGTVAYQVFAYSANNVVTPTGDDAILGGGAKYANFLWHAAPGAGDTIIASGTGDYTANVGSVVDGVTYYGDAGNNVHNEVSNIDLSWLGGQDAYYFTTMGCGNDILTGHLPDGGATVAMLGAGLAGLALVRRRMA